MKLVIQNMSDADGIPDKQLLQSWASAALADDKTGTEVTLRIVDEDEGRELNHQWRKKDYATNVLSFPVGERIEQAPEFLGDMVICAPVVTREANEQGKTLDAHWAHLIVHGILHLQGYDHEKVDDAETMEKLEITILQKIGYANPYEVELHS